MQTFTIDSTIFSQLASHPNINLTELNKLVSSSNSNPVLNKLLADGQSGNVILRVMSDFEVAENRGVSGVFLASANTVALHPHMLIGTNATMGAPAIGVVAHEFDHYKRRADFALADALIAEGNILLQDPARKGEALVKFEQGVKLKMETEMHGWWTGVRTVRAEKSGGNPDQALTGAGAFLIAEAQEKMAIAAEAAGKALGLRGEDLANYVVKESAGTLSKSTIYWNTYSGETNLSAADKTQLKERMNYYLASDDGISDFSSSTNMDGSVQTNVLYNNNRSASIIEYADGGSTTILRSPAGAVEMTTDVVLQADGRWLETASSGTGVVLETALVQRFDDGSSIVYLSEPGSTTVITEVYDYDKKLVARTTDAGGPTTNLIDVITDTSTSTPSQSPTTDATSTVNETDDRLIWNGDFTVTGMGNVNTDGAGVAVANNTAAEFIPGNHQNVLDVFSQQPWDDPFFATNSMSAAQLGAATNSWSAALFDLMPTDPLVLDLNGDGVRLTNYADSPVLFDADNDDPRAAAHAAGQSRPRAAAASLARPTRDYLDAGGRR